MSLKKNNKAKIKKSGKIKMYEDSSRLTKIPQSVRKRDNKVRTFGPKDSKIDSSLKDFEIDSFLKDSKIDSSLKDFEIHSLPEFNEKLNRLKKYF